MLDWLRENPKILVAAGGSVVMLLVSVVLVGVVLVRIPDDYFEHEKPGKERSRGMRLVTNIGGWVLILAGLAMLALPGQGFLVILMGVMLVDFPGKFRVQRWIMSRKAVLGTANKLRKRFGKPPLKVTKS